MGIGLSKPTLGILALGCFTLDQAIKYLVRIAMAPGDSLAILPNVLHITYVHNTGVAFSLFRQYPQGLLLLTMLLFGVFLVLAFKPARYTLLQWLGFGFVLGGEAGNIADRILFGKVIDYIDVAVIRYPVFNLADSFICVGVGLLLLHYWQKGSYDNGTHSAV